MSQFVVKPSDEFICGICYDVLNNPHQCSSGHTFCLSCLRMSLQRRKYCPTCNIALSDTNPIKSLGFNQLIQKMEVKCSAHISGCYWTGRLESLSQHISSCGYVSVDCPLFKIHSSCPCNGKVIRQYYYSHVVDVASTAPELLSSFIPLPVTEAQENPKRGDYVGEQRNGKPHG